MKTIVPTVKGARDFYPEDMFYRNWLYQNIRQVSESFGYVEWDGPFLEKIELYAAKSGEELVMQQAFVFEDRGGDKITLRPELTPSLARMVAQKQNELVYPLRWWSFGPFWRYERPQKGRSREFFQWNIDMIGVNTPETDAELIGVCASFFKRLGLTSQQVRINVNNRRLMEIVLTELGVVVENQKAVFGWLDRRDKMKPEEWDQYGLQLGLTETQLAGLKEKLTHTDLWEQSDELRRFFAAIDALGVRDYVVFDPNIIRGLDYYTGIVFEARDLGEGGRAILGGGHYDNLVAAVGGDPLPGVGFAMGDVMMTLVLRKYGLLPAVPATPASVLVTVFEETLLPASYRLAASLRSAGLNTICYTENVKIQKQLKFADRVNLRFAVILGGDEAAAGTAVIKDLHNHTQQTVPQTEVAAAIQKMLA